MPGNREPWVKVKIGIRRSGKMTALPSDTARLGWIYTLLEAKVQREPGTFISTSHFREVMGRFGRFLRNYRDVGLIEVGPDLCQDCARLYEGLKDGHLAIHDYLVEQRTVLAGSADEPSPGAKRTAMWRLRQMIFERDQWTCRYCGRDDYDRDWLIAEHVDPDGPTTPENLVTACRGCNKRKGNRTPEQAGMKLRPEPSGDGSRNGHGDASQDASDASRDGVTSRARGTTATATTTESLPEEDPSGVRADIAALRARGWKRVTKAQRAVLDEVLDRHDVTGPAFAAEVIRATPGDRDPLEAVMEADRLWQDAQRRRADAEEAGWSAEKAAERDDASKLPWLASR